MVLDSLENSKQKNKNKNINNQRNYLAHLELVRKIDFARIQDLGLSATFSPLWFFEMDSTKKTLKMVGPHKIEGYYPIKSLIDLNVICGIGSDWPVTDFNPFYGIEVALTHRFPGDTEKDNEKPFNPFQILNYYEILNAYTINSAKLLHLDKISGSLEVGKYLDMIVLDADLFEVPKNTIHKISIEETYLSGNLVYKKEI